MMSELEWEEVVGQISRFTTLLKEQAAGEKEALWRDI